MPRTLLALLATTSVVAAGCATMPGAAPTIDFGDDTSVFANDDECDDPRFSGDAMAMSPSRSHEKRDASDCRSGIEAGTLTFLGDLPPLFAGEADGIDFGDNSGPYVDDGECDDPRFSGDDVAIGAQRDNARKDAHDCHAAVMAGGAEYTGELQPLFTGVENGVDFGDNSGPYVADGECDDPRFSGDAVAMSPSRDNVGKDAHDCRSAVIVAAATYDGELEPLFTGMHDGIDFGDNSGSYTDDGECDDRRFRGFGMANPPFQADSERGDAHDCKAMYDNGFIRLAVTYPLFTGVHKGINFGANAGLFALDGECDDPRFSGPGASLAGETAEPRQDAVDCKIAFDEGSVVFVGTE